MRNYLLIFLFAVSYVAIAQKTEEQFPQVDYKEPCKATLMRKPLTGSVSADNVARAITAMVPNLQGSETGLLLNYATESPGGHHFSFNQTYRGIIIYQAEVKLTVDRNNTMRWLLDNSYNTTRWHLAVKPDAATNIIAVNPETGEAVAAIKTIENHYEVIRHKGQILYQRDTRSYFALPDTLVTGRIFNPDPLTTAQQIYGGAYTDRNDSNNTELENQLQTVSFYANHNGTQFTLESDFVKIVDNDTPNILPAVSLQPQFLYNRSQKGFEDVNVFYHISNYRNHVNSLGFTLANHLVLADAHGMSGGDQSAFVPGGNPPSLTYGDGNVDDGEDADVIVHEYGHFLSYNAAPGSNTGFERRALDEAFGDYIAASYSKAINSYNSHWLFNWDGHNEFWNGRVVNSSKKYTDNTSSIYTKGEVWATMLMNIHDEIGRAATDSLIYQTHYSYAGNITMEQAANLLLDADTLLNNGAYSCVILKYLYDKVFLLYNPANPCGISSVNHTATPSPAFTFAQNGHSFTVTNNSPTPYNISLYSIDGRLMAEWADINQPIFSCRRPNFPNGIYVIVINRNNTPQSFKWNKNE